MRYQNILFFLLMALLIVTIAAFAKSASPDKDNLRWHKAWTSPNEGEVEQGIGVPKRAHCAAAWFDFDGDGNQEFFVDDNDMNRTYVYENAGENNYEFRWYSDFVDAGGKTLYHSSTDKGETGTDLDGDGADELILIRTTMKKGDPNHIAPIRIYKHEAGSEEFLPASMEWTVEWDNCPIANPDSILRIEYYNYSGAGDWDKDGRGEFSVNYKQDPKYFFAMIEVVPPLVPDQVQFKIEHMIEKKANYNVSQINPVDLDGDSYKELFLPARETAGSYQYVYYLDCTGPNSWVEYFWGDSDARMYPDSVYFSGEWNFTDLDKDGMKEFYGFLPCPAKLPAWGGGQRSLWVAKLNPSDPAHLFSKDKWYRINTVEEMLGMAPKTYTTGFSIPAAGDADADCLPDIYVGLAEAANPSRIVDAEFVGTDYTNPAHWNYYTIIKLPEDAGLADKAMPILGTKLFIGDGDKDGKVDLFHSNRSGNSKSIRPGAFVWEFDEATLPTDVSSHPGDDSKIPVVFNLMQNYPNPFNPSTTICFNLNKASRVELNVYDVRGRLVAKLLDAQKPSGMHQVMWNGNDADGIPVASGVYFYSISDQSSKLIRKMMLIK